MDGGDGGTGFVKTRRSESQRQFKVNQAMEVCAWVERGIEAGGTVWVAVLWLEGGTLAHSKL